MYSPEAIELIRKMDTNKLPVFIISFLGCILCIYGAIEMRKLKLSGFYAYIIGSVVPYIGMVLFLGIGFFSGWSAYAGAGISAIFVILYGLQTKFLVNK